MTRKQFKILARELKLHRPSDTDPAIRRIKHKGWQQAVRGVMSACEELNEAFKRGVFMEECQYDRKD